MKNQDNNKNRKKHYNKNKAQKFGRTNLTPKVPKSLKINNMEDKNNLKSETKPMPSRGGRTNTVPKVPESLNPNNKK